VPRKKRRTVVGVERGAQAAATSTANEAGFEGAGGRMVGQDSLVPGFVCAHEQQQQQQQAQSSREEIQALRQKRKEQQHLQVCGCGCGCECGSEMLWCRLTKL
jgi:hypothetical protein